MIMIKDKDLSASPISVLIKPSSLSPCTARN